MYSFANFNFSNRRAEDKYSELNNSKLSPISACLLFLLNALFICYCCSEMFDLCHNPKGLINYFRVSGLPCIQPRVMTICSCCIRGSHSGKYKHYCLLGCNSIQFRSQKRTAPKSGYSAPFHSLSNSLFTNHSIIRRYII